MIRFSVLLRQLGAVFFVAFNFLPPRAVEAEEHADTLCYTPLGTAPRLLWYDRLERDELAAAGSSLGALSRAPQLVAHVLLDSSYAYRSLRERDRKLVSLLSIRSLHHPEAHRKSPSLESFSGEFLFTPDPSLTFHLAGALDEAKARDPGYTGKKWRGLAGDLSSAMIGYAHRGVQLWLGRIGSSWGDRQSLILSPDVPLDGLEYALHWHRLTLRYRLAWLGTEAPPGDSTGDFTSRYLAGHRLEYDISRNMTLGFGEMVVFGGAGRSLDFGYLNPLLFFHGAQLNENINDNTLLFGDLAIRPWPGVRCYGQLVIDDFQIDHTARGDKEPAQYALTGKIDAVNILSQTDLHVRYTRVTNWTYNQIEPRNRYTIRDLPIAAVHGNDYDELTCAVDHWLGREARLQAEILLRRQGEGRITAPWTQPWITAPGAYTEPFPTGVVESLVQPTCHYEGWLTHWLFIQAGGGIHLLTNEGNVPGTNASRLFGEFALTVPLSFSIPLN